MERCATCHYVKVKITNKTWKKYCLLCRRYPPKDMRNMAAPSFPVVLESDEKDTGSNWCGEYKEEKDAAVLARLGQLEDEADAVEVDRMKKTTQRSPEWMGGANC